MKTGNDVRGEWLAEWYHERRRHDLLVRGLHEPNFHISPWRVSLGGRHCNRCSPELAPYGELKELDKRKARDESDNCLRALNAWEQHVKNS